MLKRIGLYCSLFFCAALGVHGQVDISLEFKKDFYLAHESILAEVKIVNFSGKTLNFGLDKDWLQFTIESKSEFPVEKAGDLDVVEGFQVPNASRAIRRVHLIPAYKIDHPGRYRIAAYINVPELNTRLVTVPIEIGILSETVIWEREIGVVKDEKDPSAPIEIRRYSLMRAVNENQIDLYVKVTDKYQRDIYGVYSLGNIVSFGEPERQVDRYSNLHVLMQNGARSFRYSIIKPDGKILLRERHDYTNTRPKLMMDKSGLIQVHGGIRKPSFDDIPTPEQMNEVKGRNLNTAALADNNLGQPQGGQPEAE
ncbi:MAG: hypothetical protein HOH33_14495 [Verrucomicrobia bacterium]|jgi:hypothetical protein|nr:hypothetical protein [Verrucomicrobiota bacterium]